jgi:hypothetical protein
MVEAALYGGVVGFALLIAACIMGFGGLAVYLVFGW